MVLNNDNDDSRKLVEQCYKLSRFTLNPIIDWTDAEVWEFIKGYNVPYCKLYDQGYKRLGCIGCPMGDNKTELEKNPKFKKLYLLAFKKMLDSMDIDKTTWKNEKDVFNWWISWNK